MATIQVGSARAGKKPLDTEVPLIPFIDLLLCCIMFLLVTAVWNQLAAHQAVQHVPGHEADAPINERLQLVLQLSDAGYVVASTAGDRFEIPKRGGSYDVAALQERLAVYRHAEPNRRDITLVPDDGVAFDSVVEAMDAVAAHGFDRVSFSDS